MNRETYYAERSDIDRLLKKHPEMRSPLMRALRLGMSPWYFNREWGISPALINYLIEKLF